MDLSGFIFVALALGWGAYLIPKALQRHDELARSRSVEQFSSRLRVLGARSRAEERSEVSPRAESVADRVNGPAVGHAVVSVTAAGPVTESAAGPAVTMPAAAAPAASAPTAGPASSEAPVLPPAAPPAIRMLPVSRAAARRAATRRRRVLYVLLLGLVGTGVAAYLERLPWWGLAVPGGLVVAFLAIARVTVRHERRRARVVVAGPVNAGDVAAVTASPKIPLEPGVAETVDEGREDTVGVVLDQPLVDEGSLWDPLPMTLPTYVSKPRARRTVRTIELTRKGVTSSGHDAADSELVREAEAAARRADAETAVTAPAEGTEEQRRAAGM